ncbi:hepatitis A virus cellular receptor 1-like [Corticium candelabrum]|uniref:hepatitis A virus cellular receptor 1-like n=1 Tax=Corticium candelabrum TaxID=121492 RepID=UPI002E26B308|nr:hepatitis A virus cellular receptor 1-like [Corticium candelabrum]
MNSPAANALVFLVAFTLLTLSEVSSCSSGWTLSGSSCYRRFNTKKTWNNAEADCVKRGGHLVSIGSFSENTLVYDIEGSNNRENVWIGINKDRSSKVWSDGTNISYKLWNKDRRRRRRDDDDDDDECVRMRRKNGKWDYKECDDDDDEYYYVCETSAPTTNPSTTIVSSVQISTAPSTTVAATTYRSTTRNPTTSASITTQSTSVATTVVSPTTAEGSTQLVFTTVSKSESSTTQATTSVPTTEPQPTTDEASTQLPTTTTMSASLLTQSSSTSKPILLSKGITQLPTTTFSSASIATRSTSLGTTVSRPNTIEVSTQLPTTTMSASSRKTTRATTRMSRTTTARANDALSTPIRSTPSLPVLPRGFTKAVVTKRKFESQIHTTQISRATNSFQSTSTKTRETTTQPTANLNVNIIANEAKSSSSNTTIYAAVGAAIGVIVLIVSVISVFVFWRRRAGKSDAKTIRSHEHVADKSYENGVVVNSTISRVFFTKSWWANDVELTAISLNRKHKESNASNTMDVKTSDDMQLNPLYSTNALRNLMTENFSMAASRKDSRSGKIITLYQSADLLERPTARESENVIYNM